MNIMIVDSQHTLNPQLQKFARNRLFYSLLRFEHRLNGATMHLSVDEHSSRFKCAIHASVEGVGIVTVRKSGNSAEHVVNLAVDAIEPIIAYRVDWRAFLNADLLATWITSMKRPWRRILGKADRESSKSHHVSRADVENRQHVGSPNLQRGAHVQFTTKQQAKSFLN